ncbi:MFS general substrate transporter [Periconia macrospinosa]|uniref:MFS general substrate transporter n=1 Tax=Periconia macrospinosa TaxID=97972 RepID=A0A2V1DXE4_9PLEO|nr:MFS general substrate transporter [Periconia macrospinosa]
MIQSFLGQRCRNSFHLKLPRWKLIAHHGFWPSLIAICIPLLLSALEGSVTNTALPTISEALDLGTSFSWVATAFLLASTVFQPLYGQLGDMWGRKHPMMIAVAVFAVGSAIAGGAYSGGVLIFGRIIQGLGVGGIDLFSEMILCDIIPLRHRGPYIAIKHAVFGVGTAVGPPLGGAFAEHGWRWCFLINIPICAVSLVVLYFCLKVKTCSSHNGLKEELKKVDYCGTLLLTGSVIMILVALSIVEAPYPWSHAAVIAPLSLGALGITAFGIFQRSKYCTHPIMPSNVFSNLTTNIAFALTAIHGFVTYGFQFYLPPFFQAVKGSSPTQSGLEVLPTTLIIVVVAAIGGPLLSFWGRYKPIHIIGFSCMTLGLGLCITLERSTPVPAWLIFQFLVAFGSGVVALLDSATGQSAGSWAFLRGTGSLFGVAMPGAMFNLQFTRYLPRISSEVARAQLAHGKAYQRATSSYIHAFPPDVQEQIRMGFTVSLKCVWTVMTVVVAIGFILTWIEKEHKMRKNLNSAFGLENGKTTTDVEGSAP